MASAEHPLLKQCRIKTGVVVRTRKELDRYKEEMDSQRAKIEAMRAEGRDEFDVRQQQQVFNETERVIPDTIRRLQKAVDDLTEFLVSTLLPSWHRSAGSVSRHHLSMLPQDVNRGAAQLVGSALLTAAEEAVGTEPTAGGEGGAASTADDAI